MIPMPTKQCCGSQHNLNQSVQTLDLTGSFLPVDSIETVHHKNSVCCNRLTKIDSDISSIALTLVVNNDNIVLVGMEL